MKQYDLIKRLLEEEPKLRDSDQELQWKIWELQGVANGSISKDAYLFLAKNAETIRRTRQKVQQDHPELGPNLRVKVKREEKQHSKGTFVYREEVKVIGSDNILSGMPDKYRQEIRAKLGIK